MDRNLFEYVLRLGDDALILAQRLTEWCGHAPTIEVDLSIANIGLDLMGQATLFLEYAAQTEGAERDADALAFRRDASDFRNALLVEQPNGDFAQTMARQFLFSTWQKLLLERLAFSKDEQIAAIAAKAVKEVTYHVEIAGEWIVRLGDGTEESKHRLEAGLAWMWRFVPELFATDEIDADIFARGIGIDPMEFQAEFDVLVRKTLAEALLAVPPAHRAIIGGRNGRHGEHLGHILGEMQFLQRAYPDAKW
jgi:ring-1,2-phenylacetyl-CoA epoxidase subunit PaaC